MINLNKYYINYYFKKNWNKIRTDKWVNKRLDINEKKVRFWKKFNNVTFNYKYWKIRRGKYLKKENYSDLITIFFPIYNKFYKKLLYYNRFFFRYKFKKFKGYILKFQFIPYAKYYKKFGLINKIYRKKKIFYILKKKNIHIKKIRRTWGTKYIRKNEFIFPNFLFINWNTLTYMLSNIQTKNLFKNNLFLFTFKLKYQEILKHYYL